MASKRWTIWAILGSLVGLVFGYLVEVKTKAARDSFGEWLTAWAYDYGGWSWLAWLLIGAAIGGLIGWLRSQNSN